MEVYLIAILKQGSTITGYRLLDTNANNGLGEIKDVTTLQLLQALAANKIKVHGLKIEKRANKYELKGSNGSLDRYPTITPSGVYLNTLVVINQLYVKKFLPNNGMYGTDEDVTGFTLTNYSGKLVKAAYSDAIMLAEKHGLANGKLVQKENNKFISSIVGSYPGEVIELVSVPGKTDKQMKTIGPADKSPQQPHQPPQQPKQPPKQINELQYVRERNILDKLKDKENQESYIIDKYENDWVSIDEFEKYMEIKGYRTHLIKAGSRIEVTELDERMELLNIPVGTTALDDILIIRENGDGGKLTAEGIEENNLRKIKIPNTIKIHAGSPFKNLYKLEFIEFQEGSTVINLSGYNQEWQSLQEIKIPSTVIHAFKLVPFNNTVDLTNTNIQSIIDSYNKSTISSIKFPDTLITISESFKEVQGDATVVLPGSLDIVSESFKDFNGNIDFTQAVSLKTISGEESFSGISMKHLDLSKTALENIGAHRAFYECRNLETVEFPETLKAIGDSCFRNCGRLVDFDLKNIKRIGLYSFSNTNIKNVTMKDGLAIYSAFNENTVYDTGTVKQLNVQALKSVTGESLVINDDVELIQMESLAMSKFNSMSISKNLVQIINRGFLGVRLDNTLDMSECTSLRKIPEEAFAHGSISEIILPDGLTEIGINALRYNSGLERIYIPKTVTKIGRSGILLSGESAPGGTAFYVYKGSEADKYCSKHSLKTVYISSLKEYKQVVAVEKEALKASDTDKAKVALILSGTASGNRLLTDEYIDSAKDSMLVQLKADSMYNPNKQWVELDTSKFSSYDLDKCLNICDMVVNRQSSLNDPAGKTIMTSISLFNNYCNLLTTISKPMEVVLSDSMDRLLSKLYKDEKAMEGMVIYDDGQNSIHRLQIYKMDVLKNKVISIYVVKYEGSFVYVTGLTENSVTGASLLSLRKRQQEIGAEITTVLKDEIDVGTVSARTSSARLNGNKCDVTISTIIKKHTDSAFKLIHFDAIKSNFYGNGDGKGNAVFMSMITGKVYFTEVRYTYPTSQRYYGFNTEIKTSPNEGNMQEIWIKNIKNSLADLDKKELEDVLNYFYYGQSDKFLESKTDRDSIETNTKLLGDLKSTGFIRPYEVDLADTLVQLGIESVADLTEASIKAIGNTVYFKKKTVKYSKLMSGYYSGNPMVMADGKLLTTMLEVDKTVKLKPEQEIEIVHNGGRDVIIFVEDKKDVFTNDSKVECFMGLKDIGAVLRELLELGKKRKEITGKDNDWVIKTPSLKDKTGLVDLKDFVILSNAYVSGMIGKNIRVFACIDIYTGIPTLIMSIGFTDSAFATLNFRILNFKTLTGLMVYINTLFNLGNRYYELSKFVRADIENVANKALGLENEEKNNRFGSGIYSNDTLTFYTTSRYTDNFDATNGLNEAWKNVLKQ